MLSTLTLNNKSQTKWEHVSNEDLIIDNEILMPEELLNLLIHDSDQYLFHVYIHLRKLIVMEDDSKLIDKLIFFLEKQVRANIYDALLLATEEPEALIQTLKICECEDKIPLNQKTNMILCYHISDWIKWREKECRNEKIKFSDFPVYKNSGNNSMKDKVKTEILARIVSDIHHLQQKAITCDKRTDFLNAVDRHMKDLTYVNQYFQSTFPTHYDIVNYYVTKYFQHLDPLIASQFDTISFSDILIVVSWIPTFQKEISNMVHDIPVNIEAINNITVYLSEKENTLLASYIQRCRDKLHCWTVNIIDTQSKNTQYFFIDNMPRTHCAQDLFTALNHQFDVARNIEQNIFAFSNVNIMILQCIDKYKTLLQSHVKRNWKCFDDEYFIAIINSVYEIQKRLSAKLVDLDFCINYLVDCLHSEKQNATIEITVFGYIRQFVDQQLSFQIPREIMMICHLFYGYINVKVVFNARVCALKNMAKEYAVLLAEKIYIDALQVNIFDELFGNMYFKSTETNSEIKSLVLTLKEYFQDFVQWIEAPNLFCDVVKEMIEIVVSEYGNRLEKKIPSGSNYQYLANNVKNDIKLLDEYFGNYQKHIVIACSLVKVEQFSQDEFDSVEMLWKEKIKLLYAMHNNILKMS